MDNMMGHIDVGSYQLEPGILITARSFLVDRAVPDCEIIALPGREAPGGKIPYKQTEILLATKRTGWRRILKGPGPRHPEPLKGKIGVDCRHNSPENWSHFLNMHVPVVFEIARQLNIDPTDLTLILPAKTPKFILAAAEHLGFKAQATGATVTGRGIIFQLSTNITVPDRRKYLMASGIVDHLAHRNASKLPRHVFLARRQTRNISNQAEIEKLLHPRGYETIYPEDLSISDQFQIFNTAEKIVAVSGAGLGPLLYRHPEAPLEKIIEIMPCGLVSDYFRLMSQQVGCKWIGVRGRLKPKYIKPAYEMKGIFVKFVMDSFEVDPVSLDRALSMG